MEDEDEEDCAPVPTFQSAFTKALVAADWTRCGFYQESQGEACCLYSTVHSRN